METHRALSYTDAFASQRQAEFLSFEEDALHTATWACDVSDASR